jgi:RsmE family RNA methyltransferase
MNLLLLDPAELEGDLATVSGRRAEHLRDVLRAGVGDRVRAGLIGGAIGNAEIVADDGDAVALRFVPTRAAPPQLDVELVLAVPRPKVLSRVIEICAAFAVRRVDLTNAWRVDKSYLSSPRLGDQALAQAARLGAEQGGTTQLPELHVHTRLMELLDDRFPALGGPNVLRLLAHPTAPPIERVVTIRAPAIVAIGPEGGWIQRELDTFVDRGFAPVSIGAPILRVEAAISAVLGQLLLLGRLR